MPDIFNALPGIEVPVANGTAFGNGIYLGLTPELSESYARDSQSLLLVKVLGGRNKRLPLDLNDCLGPNRGPDFPVDAGAFQSYEPNNNMLIVASSILTLPCYVVHWA